MHYNKQTNKQQIILFYDTRTLESSQRDEPQAIYASGKFLPINPKLRVWSSQEKQPITYSTHC